MTDSVNQADIGHETNDKPQTESFWWRVYDFPFKASENNRTRLQDIFGSAAILPGGIVGGMIANHYASTPLLTEIYNNTGMAIGAVIGFKAGHIAAYGVHRAGQFINKCRKIS